MASKTFKIGEYATGGIISAEIKGEKVTIICKEWDFSKGSSRGSDQSGAKELMREERMTTDRSAARELENTLTEWTTSYYAGKIMEWIKSKTKFKNESIW